MKLSVLDKESLICLGSNLFKVYNLKAYHTDYSLLTGGDVSFSYLVSEEKSKRADGEYWTGIGNYNGRITTVDNQGNLDYALALQRNIGIRLMAKYSDYKNFIKEEKVINNTISEILIGTFPKDVCNCDISNNLERLYRNDSLQRTSQKYLINCSSMLKSGYLPQFLYEYYYRGHCYIRVIDNNLHNYLYLNSGELSKNGNYYWVLVEPVIWLVDKEYDLMITKDVIMSGIPFHVNRCSFDNYDNSFLKMFIEEIMEKEIFGDNLDKDLNMNKKVLKLK